MAPVDKDKHSEYGFPAVWLLVTLWLMACSLLVGGEYTDGFNTIANARYFFGDNPDYFFQRGPLAAIALWPVEALRGFLNVSPFDVRPYHIYSGLLHSAYLVGCWLLLKYSAQPFRSRLIAFIAAILSVVFYAYAPYLSHDLIPGLLFLLMIFLGDRWIRNPDYTTALLLIILGTAVTFIKQSYAIFWVALCVYALIAFAFKWDTRRVSASRMFSLFALAAVSGVLSYVGYGWVTGSEISEVSLLERPLVMLRSVSVQYADEGAPSTLFPWYIYLRNLHNYGTAAILLVIPGAILALRGHDARLKMIATCWLFCAVMLQFVAFKEARYLAFLAPLAAMLIAPAISLLSKSRAWLSILLLVVAADQYRGISMATAQIISAPDTQIARFVGDFEAAGRVVTSPYLSFTVTPASPMYRDRYHGIFNIGAEHFDRLSEGSVTVTRVADPRDFGWAGIRAGDRVFHSNLTLARTPPWDADNKPNLLDELVMAAGNASYIDLVRNGEDYEFQAQQGNYIMVLPVDRQGMPTIARDRLSVANAELLLGDGLGASGRILGVVVDALCLADRCYYFDLAIKPASAGER